MVEIQLAQAMTDDTLSMRTEQKKVAATPKTTQKQLESNKQLLITSQFQQKAVWKMETNGCVF